ncbi:hypothetical protein KCU85_g7507, partial [Aureobasidium melanogenum]
MDGGQSTPDLKEQYRNAVLNLPIDNPTAYLREIKRLQGLMLDMEFEQLDHDQEPEKVRKDFNEVKKNTRELRLSPACLRAVQDSENAAGEESALEKPTVEKSAVKKATPGEPAVNEFIALTEEPAAKEPAITETTAKKNKKKKKKKPASKNAASPEPTTNNSEMDSDAEAKALRMRITHNYLDLIRPKSSTDADSAEYRMELIQNVANELLNVKCMVLNFMDTSDSFNAKAMEEMEKLGERLINLKDGNRDLMAVINELDKLRMRGLKCKKEVKDLKEELDEVKMEYDFTKNEVIGVKLEFEDTKLKLAGVRVVLKDAHNELAEAKKELDVTRQEFAAATLELVEATKELKDTKEELIQFKWKFEDAKIELEQVKEKNLDMEKKMNEMYAWFNKQKEVPLSHFH